MRDLLLLPKAQLHVHLESTIRWTTLREVGAATGAPVPAPSAGPSIREAIDVGHAERIGHGIRVLDDASLVAEVRDRAIPLEVCPSSNVALGLAASFEAHPLPRLRDAGLRVTVNTDIPLTAGTTLTEEYARIRTAFGYDDATLADLSRTMFLRDPGPFTRSAILP